MELNIQFGIDFEIRRTKDTLARLDWFRSQKYLLNLPKHITEESTEQQIMDQVKKEYDEKKYKALAQKILQDFSKFEKQFSQKIKDIFKEDAPNKFIVYLTNYGVGGSYNLPNIIVLNINNLNGVKTIFHEIIHILIEPSAQKHNINHWEKERIVDLVLNSKEFEFLEYNHWQKNYNNVEKYIDNLFKKCFNRNFDGFFSQMRNARL